MEEGSYNWMYKGSEYVYVIVKSDDHYDEVKVVCKTQEKAMSLCDEDNREHIYKVKLV